MDHAWDKITMADAVIGFKSRPRHLRIFGPDALAVAVTGQVCAISFEHGNGVKVVLGLPWLRRAEENARKIEQAQDDL